ncbi:MAG TPA: trehalose-phosphatase [Propionibacteriaceae bacterium]|jgi:trehalose 6-phosphate phosphatase|nr:trehalose-phosphatase [Propionibacteriaceae bacterium]
MSLPEPRTAVGAQALQKIIDSPGDTLIALDFDGTLAPIVDDPERAYADPAAVAALGRLGERVGAIVVITGRPVRTAVRLGGFNAVTGLGSMVVLGQYGVERWNAAGDSYVLPPEPDEIVAVAEEIPPLLASLGLAKARVEHKGRAVGVHTRTLADPAQAFGNLEAPIRALAERHGLRVEPGKNVWEIRASGVDKGASLRSMVAEAGARQVVFAGDDLGDLPAFEAVRALRAEGLPGLLVCSASYEEDALVAISDVILDGTAGVADWLGALADAIDAAGRPSLREARLRSAGDTPGFDRW